MKGLLQSLSHVVERFSSGRWVVVALVVLTVFSWWMTKYNPKNSIGERMAQKFCCEKCLECQASPFFSTDSSYGFFTFTPAKLYKMLDEYDPEGKDLAAHRKFIKLDFLYPFSYSIAFALLISWFVGALPAPVAQKFWWASLIPLAAALFDLLENTGMLLVLSGKTGTNNPNEAQVYFTMTMNLLKWLGVYFSLIIIFVLTARVVNELRR